MQMLLDKYSLSKAFEHLMSYHNPSSTPHVAPAGFVKRVNQAMNRIDPLLKTLQVRPSPPEGLVQAYLIHIGDRSDTNFKKILDLKGVRKQEQNHLLELFQIHREGNSKDKLVQNSPLLTPLMTSSGLGSSGMSAMNQTAALAAAGGAALQTRFDAASIGEKLLSAAREIGTSSADKSGTPGTEKATINENLKNFGRFFKQDIGGFAARFGKRDGSQGAHVDDSR
jgi:vacuolar protein sorting-associated protein 53